MRRPSIDVVMLQRLAPIVAPIVVLLVLYVAAISPRIRAGRESVARAQTLRVELTTIRHQTQLPAPSPPFGLPGPPSNPLRDFEARIPDEDQVPALLEALARRVLSQSGGGEIRNLLIETGARVEVAPAAGADAAPRVADETAQGPDPRFALFPHPLAYTPVTITFESTYATIGQFLWRLRGLPTTIEIRSLELAHVAPDDSRVRASLVLLAYQRTAAERDTRVIVEGALPAERLRASRQ